MDKMTTCQEEEEEEEEEEKERGGGGGGGVWRCMDRQTTNVPFLMSETCSP